MSVRQRRSPTSAQGRRATPARRAWTIRPLLVLAALVALLASSSVDYLLNPNPVVAQVIDPIATASVTPTNTVAPAPVPTATATPTEVASASPTATASATPAPQPNPDIVDVLVDSAGGTVTSADGRAEITVPAGATAERLDIRVSRRDPRTLPLNGEHQFVAMWNFEASAVDRRWEPVRSFDVPLTVKVRLSESDLRGLMMGSVQMYAFNEVSKAWEALPTTMVGLREWTVTTTHFSSYGPAADEAVMMPALTNQATVGLNGGSAQLALPIDVPPGRNGFAPSLALTYSSASVNEMKSRWAMGSWVGIGFSLDLPYISLEGSTYFLNLNGVSDGIVKVDASTYRLQHENHLKLTTSCSGPPPTSACSWIVIDKAGTVYKFGDTLDSYRYWKDNAECAFVPGCTAPEHPYRWDLSTATDVHGNSYSVTYQQATAFAHWSFRNSTLPPIPYVMASYPSTITYNQGGVAEAQIRFITETNYMHTDVAPPPNPLAQTLHLRDDSPLRQDTTNGYPPPAPLANCAADEVPLVTETRYLTQIEVLARDPNADSTFQPVRSYLFGYEPIKKGCDLSGNTNGAGELRLDTVAQYDRSGAGTPLYTRSFDYQPYRFNLPETLYDYTRPFLSSYKNGFGGEVQFTYQVLPGGVGNGFWSRVIVTEKREKQGWGGSGDITTAYDYSAGYPDYISDGGAGVDSAFKGYREVKTTDAAGNYSVHKFHTVAGTSAYDPLEGREFEATTYAAGGGPFLQQTNDTWLAAFSLSVAGSSVPVAYVYLKEHRIADPDPAHAYARYTRYTATDQTGGSCTEFSLTCEVTQTMERGNVQPGVTAPVTTKQEFHAVYNAATNLYLVKPKWTRTYAGDLQNPPAPLAAETAFYYDGAFSFDTAPTKGNLTATRATEKTSPTTTYVCAYSAYDTYGNVLRSSVPTTNPGTQTTCPGGTTSPTGGVPSGVAYSETVYDTTFHKFPLTRKQPLVNVPLETTVLAQDFDFVLGKPRKVASPDGNVTEFLYDGFGRPTKVWDSLGSEALPATTYNYGWGAEPNTITATYRTGPGTSDTVSQLHCFDGFGRKVEAVAPYTATQWSVSGEVLIDNRGLTKKAFVPRTTSAEGCSQPVLSNDGTSYTYDALARPTSIVQPGTGQPTTTKQYVGFFTTATIDANHHRSESDIDMYGRTRTVREYTGAATPYTLYATTTYEYDALGDLTKVTDALGNVTTINYDMLGRKASMTDPDMGAWSYGYDPAGNLASQTDARGVTTTLVFDALNRLTSKSYNNGDPGFTFTYDFQIPSYCPDGTSFEPGFGRLNYMYEASGASRTRFCYDARGRTTRVRQTVDSTYITDSTYDTANRMVDLTYPDGEVVHHTYDTTHGGLTGICKWVSQACVADATYLAGATHTAAGMPDRLPLGNNLTTDYDYDTLYPSRVKSIVTSGLAGTRQDQALTYDNVGNVTSTTDHLAGETVAYGYDELNRLTGGTGFAGGQTATYAYDKIGNMTRKKEGQLDLTLVYPTSGLGVARPHAATQAKFTGPGNAYKDLLYDPNGNLCTTTALSYCPASGDRYEFDAENRVKLRTYGAAATSYTYDGSGTMVKRTTTATTAVPPVGESTVYIGGIYEKNLTTGVVTKYYQALGRTIAMRKGGTLSYLLADHLGSTTAVLDASGNVVSSRTYWPYGAERSLAGDARVTDQWYTGQRDEDNDGLGLYNYRARMYSTLTGRFLSADPLLNDGLNHYTYVRNNPLRHVDPTGLCADGVGAACAPCSLCDALVALDAAGIHSQQDLAWYQQTVDLYESTQDAVDASYLMEACWFGCTSVGKAPSLLELLHERLDILGIVNPFADALNVLLYAAEGEYGSAALVGLGLLPVGGDGIKYLMEGSKTLRVGRASDGVITHIAFQHGASHAGKSTFTKDALYRIDDLIAASDSKSFYRTGTNYGVVVDAGRIIGTDRAGNDTRYFSVIVNSNGDVVSAYPGFFDQWPAR